MPHTRFIIRDFARSRNQAVIFVLCVVLSIVSLVAISGFSHSINDSLLKDAKALHAADIIIRSRQDFSRSLRDAVEELNTAGLVDSARYYEFYSVVRSEDGHASLLSKIKVVQRGYPFYGRCELESGRAFADVLTKGSAVVEKLLLDRLNLQVGDRLRIGMATLTISDVLLKEPDRPVSFYSFGPRIFVSIQDLAALDLLQKGSRIRYVNLLKVHDQSKLNRIADDLRTVADGVQERVDTYRTARSGIKRFFDNFLFFLSLIGMFTLLLAGIGIHSALTAYLKEKEKTIAIMKTVGATSRFIISHFMIGLLGLGLIGTVAGLVLGFVIQNVLPVLLGELIPREVELAVSWQGILQGLCLGILVVMLFAFLPLYRLKEIKPAYIFRKESKQTPRSLPYFLTLVAISIFFLGMVLWQLQEIRTGVYFVAGLIFFIIITAVITRLLLFVLQRLHVGRLTVRQALKGLFRPRNATLSIIITLTASLAVIFSIYLVEQNLDSAFVQSYPADAPNLFFVDIQPSQLEEFDKVLNIDTRYYPIVRARILAVNEEKISREKERRRRGDNLARTFNLTYRDRLLDDEIIVKGSSLFRPDWEGIQVSVLDTVAEMKEMNIGDRITFRIQGVPLQARVSSIRSRTKESIKPYFYFVFRKKVLKDAPQTIFTAVRVEPRRISAIQNQIVGRFPNVSVIDLTAMISAFARTTKKLSNVLRFFTVFSILAGLLIIISSVFATRFARTREAVYYQVLGAKSTFVIKVFGLENFFLGLVSALIALALSQCASWIITTQVFNIAYKPFIIASVVLILSMGLIVIIFGLLPSLSVLKQKPVMFLREQTRE